MVDHGSTGAVIADANADGRAALVGYLPLGFPDVRTTLRAVDVLVGRVDLLVLGHPTTDPSCDGQRVSRALLRACSRGLELDDLTDTVAAVASRVPTLVLAYWHEIVRLGPGLVARELAQAGARGVVTPDLAVDGCASWVEKTDKLGLDRVLPAPPGLDAHQLARVADVARGWVFVPAIELGDEASAAETSVRLRQVAPTALVATDVVGGGADDVRRAAGRADAVVAGTALVEALPDHTGADLTALDARLEDLRRGLGR